MSSNHLTQPATAWLIVIFLSLASPAQAQEGELMVQTYCAACHSLTLVYSQSGDNRFWRETIDLMRAKHNLGPIPPEREAMIIDYLTQRAVERPVFRRVPLEPAFLPGTS